MAVGWRGIMPVSLCSHWLGVRVQPSFRCTRARALAFVTFAFFVFIFALFCLGPGAAAKIGFELLVFCWKGQRNEEEEEEVEKIIIRRESGSFEWNPGNWRETRHNNVQLEKRKKKRNKNRNCFGKSSKFFLRLFLVDLTASAAYKCQKQWQRERLERSLSLATWSTCCG